MNPPELIREWHTHIDDRPVLVELYDTNEPHRDGPHSRLAYRLVHDGVVIFEGDDIGVPPTDTLDSDQTLASVVTFLSLRPGDTDRGYFDSYTPRQLEWAEQHGEELAVRASELGHVTTTKQMRGGGHGYRFRAVCTCGWTSLGYAARHAAQTMAIEHEGQI